MSWDDALSKPQSQDFLRSYVKPTPGSETNPHLLSLLKSERTPIEQPPYDDHGSAAAPQPELGAAPMVDSTTTRNRTRSS